MAYAKSTLADLKQSLADRHDSGILPTDSATLTFWTRLLNKGQAYCADKLRLTKPTSLTTSSGVIALPDDFIAIARIFEGENEYAQIGIDEVPYQEEAYVYWITGNHDTGFILNTANDVALTVIYSYRVADMSSDSDECVIPDPEAVVAYAYSFLRKSETDPIGDADASLQECDNRLTEIQSVQNINDGGLGFSFNA
jgi:hypothetical protein